MTYLASIGTIIILGFLYWRMVKREIPQPVGWLQALLPIAIGMLSHPLTVPFSIGFMKALANNPNSLKLSEMNFIQALGRDLILAGRSGGDRQVGHNRCDPAHLPQKGQECL